MNTVLWLIMSVEILNGCVVLPHLANWRNPVQVTERWQADVTPAVTGAEDRAAGCVSTYVRQEYHVLPLHPQENTRIHARLLEALKLGRACAPYFARAQYLSFEGQPTMRWGSTLEGVQIFNCALIQGASYRYQPGPTDIGLTCGGTALSVAGDFVAENPLAIVTSTTMQVGTVILLATTSVPTEGLWTWAAGQYAFFIRHDVKDRKFTHENKTVCVNVGGDASGDWATSSFYMTGGDAATTDTAVNTSGIIGWPAAPQAVYKSALVIDDRNAFSSSYSEAFNAWVVIGLTPGQEYVYRKGPDDVACIIMRTGGTTTVLTESARFTPDFDYVFIEVTEPVETTDPGIVKPVETIECTIGSLLRGIECNVRLHFAEFEGERIFNVEANGVLMAENVNPYARAGNALNVASYLDLRVMPDTNGQVKLSIIPAGSAFRAALNGVELYQYTWEVKELTAGTGANLLKWTGYLKGYYPPGQQVYPVIWGTPKMHSRAGITNWLSDVRLSIEEPLGVGGMGRPGQCPVETCIPDSPLAFPVKKRPTWPVPAQLTCPGHTEWSPKPMDPIEGGPNPGPYPIGVLPQPAEGVDPSTVLLPDVFDAWSDYVWNQWTQEAIPATNARLIWYWDNWDGLNWGANQVFPNMTGPYNAWAGAAWRIAVEYCPA